MTRDPSSPAAKTLLEQGADVVRADAVDPAGLRAAFAGVDGVFAMTTPAGPAGTAGEIREGMAIVDAVRAAGVPHLVYSSVGGAERGTGIPHFESKRRVEEHIEQVGLSATLLRPVFFMENFAQFMAPTVEAGTLVLRLALPAGVSLQLVAVDDIGAAAAAVLLDPGRVPGGSIELAGDELTGEQMAAAFGQARGMPSRYEALPLEVLPDEDMKAMFSWFTHQPAYAADIDTCRRLVPELHSLSDWLAHRH